ncbi:MULTISPECIES: MORN repeat-containing protein [Flavobacteriaceae]|uniref:MORN repeat-containing protein n=1 Tax=Flavobacteriaceae TaxID=49546 RepID=UPI001491F925|nr:MULTISPECIES: hypothetical protein [Allomuricauda]MDC6366918.1 hypothetical protein [Muricauda sp. AC10]
MGTRSTIYLLSFLLVLAMGTIANLLVKNNNLKEYLQQEKVERIELSKQMTLQEQLIGIDSLLVDGNYGEAMLAYNEQSQQLGEDSNALIELRIALAKKMTDLGKQPTLDASQNVELQEIDSTQIGPVVTANELKQLDSLNFVLEKTKVQLSRLKRMVKQKSFGEYLTFTSSKGSQVHYVGQVKHGKAQGHGVAILSTGSRYEGEWQNNLRHGEGTFYWHDGQYYEGEYLNDKRHGMGTYHWSNGEKFVGLWEDDQRTGEGTFYGKDGKIVASGFWENDKLIAANKP